MDYLDEIEVIEERLNTKIDSGLSSEQVKENLEKYGSNLLLEKKEKSLLRFFFSCLLEPMMLILLIALLFTLIISFVDLYRYNEADFKESYGIFASILLSTFINLWMESKSRKAYKALSKIQNQGYVEVLRDGIEQRIRSDELVVGDIVILKAGNKVYADGRIVESIDLEINESSLTGEAHSVYKNPAVLRTQTTLAERTNMAYSGTFVIAGYGKMLVTSTGYNTELGKIADNLKEEAEDKTPLDQQLAHLSKILVIIGVVVAVIMFIVTLLIAIKNNTFSANALNDIFITSTIYIVSAVPEGLPGIVAISLAINVVKMSKQNALVRKMVSVETIGCIDVICTDKTGTLTENKMQVVGFYDEYGTIIKDDIPRNIKYNACFNHSLVKMIESGRTVYSGNPTEVGIRSFFSDEEEGSAKLISPFSSEKKYMEIEFGGIRYIKGAPEVIAKKCDIDRSRLNKIDQEIALLQLRACRVVSFASKRVGEANYHYDGFVSLVDPIKKDVYDSVKEALEANIKVIIITGDSKNTATAICNQLGVLTKDSILLDGNEIDEMSNAILDKKLDKIVCIYRATPRTKLKMIRSLKKNNHVVAMTGDGINDALALKEADVGLSMGINGTEVAKEASDIVLLDDSFSTIIKAIGFGRNIYQNFKRFIVFQLTVNISFIILIMLTICLGYTSPFSALELLWVNIIMDGPPALALGTEDNKIERLKPVSYHRDDKILDRGMIYKIVCSSIVIALLCIFQTCFNYIGGTIEQQKSIIFTLFILMELANIFNILEKKLNLFRQRILVLAVLVTAIIQFLIVNFKNPCFDLAPLSLTIWIKMLVVVGISFIIIRLTSYFRKQK